MRNWRVPRLQWQLVVWGEESRPTISRRVDAKGGRCALGRRSFGVVYTRKGTKRSARLQARLLLSLVPDSDDDTAGRLRRATVPRTVFSPKESCPAAALLALPPPLLPLPLLLATIWQPSQSSSSQSSSSEESESSRQMGSAAVPKAAAAVVADLEEAAPPRPFLAVANDEDEEAEAA